VCVCVCVCLCVCVLNRMRSGILVTTKHVETM